LDHTRLPLTGMDHFLLNQTESRELGEGHLKPRADADKELWQALPVAQLHLQKRRLCGDNIASVGVQEEELAETCRDQAFSHVLDHAPVGRLGEANRTGEAQMVVAGPRPEHRRKQSYVFCGRLNSPRDLATDHRIREEW
jgi:hypothetical protein